MHIHQKIWSRANGPIPVDENGISFEIHHIDGNHNNNELSNLSCLSILDHFRIHYTQGDFQASLLILEKIGNIRGLKELGHTPKSLAAFMVKNELGLWSKESKQKALQTKRDRQSGFGFNKAIQSAAGKKGGPIGACVTNKIHKANRTGFYSSDLQRKLAIRGNTPELKAQKSAKMTGIPKPRVICPNCGKEGGGHALMQRWHFNNCKVKIAKDLQKELLVDAVN